MRIDTTLFYDVDTQRDFMLPHGALYALGAERIAPTLAAVTRLAREKNIRVLASVDRHFPGDEELKRNGGPYPDHCMDGTPGQRKIDETMPADPSVVPSREIGTAELDAALAGKREVVVEKRHVDVFVGNRNANALFERLIAQYSDIVIYGVCTDICVDYVVRALIRFGRKLHVVTDAVAALDSQRAAEVQRDWQKAGVELLTFAELRARLSS
jgi:nicotinamidase/pyrazinamidase